MKLRQQDVDHAMSARDVDLPGMASPSGRAIHADRQLIRLNLMRAWKLHRRLALGFALASLLLALSYAVFKWPVYTANSQLYLLLSLCGILPGLLVAVIVNKFDPHVYVEADVEDVLGFAPMAVLPDFNEVGDGVAAELLLRLAGAIDHAGRKGNLRTFLFAGTSSGTGVTTICARLKEAVSAMGWPAALIMANGKAGENSTGAGNLAVLCKTGLGKNAAMRDLSDEESIVLIDAAPLALSAETEYLARSVDGVLVVIESGVTTRAQLLEVMNRLQKLDVVAVGFLLNRVAMAKADPAFRHFLRDMEKHLSAQGTSSSMWPVRWHGFVNEPAPKPGHAARENAPPDEAKTVPDNAEPDARPQRTSSTLFEFPKALPAQTSQTKPTTPTTYKEKPWWLSPQVPEIRPEPVPDCAAVPDNTALPAVQAPKPPDWFWSQGANGIGVFTQLSQTENVLADRNSIQLASVEGTTSDAKPEVDSLQTEAEARIARLRELFANIGLADLHKNRRPLAEIDEQVNSVALDAQAALQSAQPSAEAPRVEPLVMQGEFQPSISPASAPSPVGEVVQPVSGDAASTIHVAAQPETASPREFIPVKDSKRASNPPAYSRWDEKEIRILPAKRGQYGSR